VSAGVLSLNDYLRGSGCLKTSLDSWEFIASNVFGSVATVDDYVLGLENGHMSSQHFSGVPAELAKSIAEIFQKRVSEDNTPGVYFALFGPDGIEFEGGFGHQRLDGPRPTAGTAFRIASCTKSFTAASILILRDRGVLNLDSPITDFVPAFRARSSQSNPVIPTVRMLMTMSGGLPTDDPWGDRQEAISNDEFNEYLRAGVPFVSVPGNAFEYSNLGYALLGQVIEAVTGRGYIDFVTTEILVPLGLTSTGYDKHVVPEEQIAYGYRKARMDWVELPFSSPGAFSAMAGLFTTAHDLARWASWLASALDVNIPETGPLCAASRREMQQISRSIPFQSGRDLSTATATGEYGYGFGLFVEKDPVWGHTVFHSGGYPGFSSHMRWNSPSGIGIVTLENGRYSGAWKPATEALDLAVKHFGRQIAPPEPWPETFALAEGAETLLRGWDDRIASDIFAENVALDIPYSERTIAIAELIDLMGGVDDYADDAPVEKSGDSPAHLVWRVPAKNGNIRCEIRLAPTNPPLIQTFNVSAETAE
jgi:CubicO group peptidase (beta-lactamase class C family)